MSIDFIPVNWSMARFERACESDEIRFSSNAPRGLVSSTAAYTYEVPLQGAYALLTGLQPFLEWARPGYKISDTVSVNFGDVTWTYMSLTIEQKLLPIAQIGSKVQYTDLGHPWYNINDRTYEEILEGF